MDALQEPAILHLIFLELSQLDLLRVQSVCRVWRATVINSTELTSLLFLHPGHGKASRERETELNPLLAEAFPSFFRNSARLNYFTFGYGNAGPWFDLGIYLAHPNGPWNRPQDRQRQEKYMRPEASWRRMLPCWPPPNDLCVNMLCEYDGVGKLARLGFSNADLHASSQRHPPWVTFGLVYDMVENAWFQGIPHYVSFMDLVFSDLNTRPRRSELVPSSALVSSEFRRSTSLCTGRMCVDLKMTSASLIRQHQLHEDGYARREEEYAHRKKSSGRCRQRRHRPERPHIFTNEFHFDDGLSFSEIGWDDIQEYETPVRPPDAPPAPCTKPSIRQRIGSYFDGPTGFIIVLVISNGPSAVKNKLERMWK